MIESFAPTAREWAGRVLRPTDVFQPLCWGAGFLVGDPAPEGFGLALLPPQSDVVAVLRVWRGSSERFAPPTALISEDHHPIAGTGKPGPARMTWFPLPRLGPGLHLVDIRLSSEGKDQPVGVGVYPTSNWSWRAGYLVTAEGQVRPAKLPYGLAWDIGHIPRDPQKFRVVENVVVPSPVHARYDLLSEGPDGCLQLTLGDDRALDPEEFAAATPSGRVPRLALYTTPDGSEVIPVHLWRDGIRIGEEARHAAWLEVCRARLQATFQKLSGRRNIKLAGYGDSLTALGGRLPQHVAVPNGPQRDTVRHYFEAYGEDWKASVRNDGGHHRMGWNHHLADIVERRWGVKVDYENWGIAGTTSGIDSRMIDGFLYPNAANADRLRTMLAGRPDLVTVGVGMNDIGDPIDTRGNVVAIGRAVQESGAEVIIIAPPRQNPNFNSRDDLLWKYTHDRVVEAAHELGAAFVPTSDLYGETGAMGLSRQSHCAASFQNHPGARELAAIGNYMGQIFR